ncbi:MAG: AI-2E family transporter [Sporomusaceae bacterium]|nr:AI-2E family transporter [Sporomusaceae bacterium]
MPNRISFWLKIILVLISLYALSQVYPIYLPVVLAMVFSFLLNPLVNFLCGIRVRGRYSLPRGAAVFCSFLLVGMVLLVVAFFALAPLLAEFNSFARDFPGLLKRVQLAAVSLNESFIGLPDNIRATITQSFSEAAIYLGGIITRFLSGVLNFAATALELIATPVLTYYFLKDWRKMKEDFLKLLPLKLRLKTKAVLKEMGLVVSNYIRGQIIISLIMGGMVFSGLYFLGVDYPLILALVAALTETIPILGPVIGAVPAIILAYLASPFLALKVLVFYLIIHQIENTIIMPAVMGKTINLHPAAIILSLLAGGHFFGIIGMMAAVPAAAILKILLKHLWRYES